MEEVGKLKEEQIYIYIYIYIYNILWQGLLLSPLDILPVCKSSCGNETMFHFTYNPTWSLIQCKSISVNAELYKIKYVLVYFFSGGISVAI